MKPYEREYFVSRIRSGVTYLKLDKIRVKVLTPTLEDELIANECFLETYEKCVDEDIMTEQQMMNWMLDRGIWSEEKDTKIENIKKDIESFKIRIYQGKDNSNLVLEGKAYLRAAEKALVKLLSEKNEYFNRSCEGLASHAKSLKIFERCCFLGKEPIDIDTFDITSLFYAYSMESLDETQLRFLARNDPWRLAWITKDHIPLFANEPGRQLSNEQKGMLIWSNMYDNVQESMNCPTEDVIEDDDMLDGWFIVQRKKQESDRVKADLESRVNPKIANSDEIWIMAKTPQEAERIHSMNSVHGETVRKQRLETVKQKGRAVDLDFQDRKLDAMNQQRQNFKNKVRRK